VNVISVAIISLFGGFLGKYYFSEGMPFIGLTVNDVRNIWPFFELFFYKECNKKLL